jgi:ABC-2 type transport system permease protein
MNAQTLMTAIIDGHEVMPTRSVIGAYWTEARFELLRTLRNPSMSLPMILVPMGFYLLIAGAVAADAIARNPKVADFIFAGFAVMAVAMPALFVAGCTLALEREAGLMRLKRALPAPTGSWLVAKTFVAVIFGALAYAPLLALALTVGKVTLGAAPLAAMSAVLIGGTVVFAAIGLLIGSLVSGSAAAAYANLFFLPCIYLSGLFFPLPKFLQAQTVIWPAFHLKQLALAAAGAETIKIIPPQISVAGLIGITVICGGLAIWRLARKG